MKNFNTATQLALWINSQNFSPLRQEQLMQQGIENHKRSKSYIIILTIGDLEYINQDEVALKTTLSNDYQD
jgi:hypothetical protein